MKISDLIRLSGETNEKNGYNGYAQAYADGYGTDYLAKKDLLSVSEIVEAQDELRKGYGPSEIYYSYPSTPASLIAEVGSVEEATRIFRESTLGKPEGYIIEKLDAIIREFGTLYELSRSHGVDLEGIETLLVGKIEYNAQRADTARSGGKKF